MSPSSPALDYESAIVRLVKELPAEQVAQLYHFARFLHAESQAGVAEDVEDDALSDAELAAEDAVWDASMSRHADKFAALKRQAKRDVEAGRSEPLFDERGELTIE